MSSRNLLNQYNPLKYNQAAYLQSAHNLSVSNADSPNLRVSFSDAVNCSISAQLDFGQKPPAIAQ
ncbi:hypothetical protein XBKB1_1560019 [Xenorhabdus bovienii str. kraussei Becker Underwood]|uniref:Uncharacterized protein n=1 Tax=Xenorhabdus bovienii str. kraussei Becker Underwood TaxID=1398204 RepID=A0A077PFV4_XENBV|nr:hypothetical protein XBKB1_1560019 [Xenorhabdus bovienii str. kraussei Becker Underwood]